MKTSMMTRAARTAVGKAQNVLPGAHDLKLQEHAMQQYWERPKSTMLEALDAFPYEAPLRAEGSSAGGVLTVIYAGLVILLLTVASIPFNTMRDTFLLQEPDMTNTYHLPWETGGTNNHTLGVSVRSYFPEMAGSYDSRFFTLVMRTVSVSPPFDDPSTEVAARKAAYCANATTYCTCKVKYGDKVRCEREVPMEPCKIGGGEEGMCPQAGGSEGLTVKSTFNDPNYDYEHCTGRFEPYTISSLCLRNTRT